MDDREKSEKLAMMTEINYRDEYYRMCEKVKHMSIENEQLKKAVLNLALKL